MFSLEIKNTFQMENPYFSIMDASTFKEEIIHFRNIGMKRLSPLVLQKSDLRIPFLAEHSGPKQSEL